MELTYENVQKMIQTAVTDIITTINKQQKKIEQKSAYAKTEALLFNYKSFKRVIKEKEEQIADLRKYGVPHKGGAVHTYCGDNIVHGISTVDETVDNAVHTVQRSVQEIMSVLNMIDAAMKGIKTDPWYKILEMRYFDGLSGEDIAKSMNCTQPNVSYHKSRLVKELALRIFPNEVAKEMLE